MQTTCTYCVHNENPDRTKLKTICKYKDKECCWQKEKFESISEEEKAKIKRKYAEEEKYWREWKIAGGIAIGYVVAICVLALIGAVLGIVFRFSHPELTETQLCIELFKHYWGLYLVVIGMYVLPKLLK